MEVVSVPESVVELFVMLVKAAGAEPNSGAFFFQGREQ